MAPGTLSPNERAARGKAARGQASRSSHAAWRAPDDRRSPIAVLEEQARTRLPELVPIRYGRMVESPFAYFRGAAAAMADDLSRTPASGLRVQLCGDAHLSNFGGFASPDRDLVFDLNDFDETLPGPWEWDVKRLAASFEIAGRSRDFDRDQRSATVAAAAREYRIAMRRFATMRDLAVWYARLDADEVIRRWGAEEDGKAAKVVRRAAEKARTKDSMRALAKLTCRVDGELRIASDAPLVVRIEELVGPEDGRDVSEEIDRVLQAYRRTLSGGARHALAPYRLVDVARKVVGVGSGHAGAHRFAARARRVGSALPPGQGGRALGPRAPCRHQPLRAPRPPRGRGAVADAGGKRHLPRLGHGPGDRRQAPGLLRPPALGLEALGRDRADDAGPDGGLRRDVRLDPRAGACALRRSHRDRRLPRKRRRVRPGHGPLRPRLRRPERARPRGTRGRHPRRHAAGRARRLAPRPAERVGSDPRAVRVRDEPVDDEHVDGENRQRQQ